MAKMILEGMQLDGIPCQVEVSTYQAYRGVREGGLQIEPDEPAGWDLERVLDRKGYDAPWLEKKLKDKTIGDEFFEAISQRLKGD